MKRPHLILLTLLLLSACAFQPAHAGQGYTQIDQETAKQMIFADDGHVIVDVRRKDEYDSGHIPGAILIPNESIGPEAPEALPDYSQVILVYCRSGNRSKQAAEKLAGMGYTNVFEFGGIMSWTGSIVTTEEEENAVKIQIGSQTFTAVLENNETARAFASLLPMELAMTELNGNEKYHYLLGPLPSAPESVDHIHAGDIMLFGDNCVVVFYRSFDTPYSYTRIGRIIDADILAKWIGNGDALVRFEKE